MPALKELRAWWQDRLSSKHISDMGQTHLRQLLQKLSGRIRSGREAREGFLEEVALIDSGKGELGVDLAQREGSAHQRGGTVWGKTQQECGFPEAERA